jgi:hypothetical protein
MITDPQLAALNLSLRLAREAEGSGPIIIMGEEVPLLGILLTHYRNLIEADNRRRAQIRRANQASRGKSGRKLTGDKPAPSTLRSRAARKRKKKMMEESDHNTKEPAIADQLP